MKTQDKLRECESQMQETALEYLEQNVVDFDRTNWSFAGLVAEEKDSHLGNVESGEKNRGKVGYTGMKLDRTFCKKLILYVFVAYFLIFFSAWIICFGLDDIAVCTETGNVSFVTREHQLQTYDVEGNLLYSVEVDNPSGGSFAVAYVDGRLHVNLIRRNTVLVFDENGEIIQTLEVSEEELQSVYYRDDFSQKWAFRYYETDTHVYKYTHPRFWRFLFVRDEIVLKIEDKESQTEVIIWRLYELDE